MLMREKEIDGIETVGDLFAALADGPHDTPLEDGMNCGMCLIYHEAKPRKGEPDSPAYVEYR
ncbi:MAG: hypothetical protein WA003_08600 [Desulfuromonadaceae bacterium]